MDSQPENTTSEVVEDLSSSAHKGKILGDLRRKRDRAERRFRRVRNDVLHQNDLLSSSGTKAERAAVVQLMRPQVEDGLLLVKSINAIQDEIRKIVEEEDDMEALDAEDNWEEQFDGFSQAIKDAFCAMAKEECEQLPPEGSIVENSRLHSPEVENQDGELEEDTVSTPVTDGDSSGLQPTPQYKEAPQQQRPTEIATDVAMISKMAAQAAVAALQAVQQTVAKPSVKLPRLELIRFNGDIMEWPEFWQTFESSVDSQSTLQNVAKFTYLKTLLTGPAAGAINGIPVTSANYPLALQLLKEKFGKPDIIIAALYAEFTKLPACNNRFDEIQKTVESVERIFRQLEAQGESIDFQRALIQQLMAKLPFQLITKLEEQRTNRNLPWTMKQLRTALTEYVSLQTSIRKMTDTSTLKQQPQRQPVQRQQQQQQRPPTMGLVAAGSGRQIQRCVFCQQTHSSDDCSVFKTMDARKQRLMDQRKCFQCAKDGHCARQCRSGRECPHCGKRGHFQALCYHKVAQPSATSQKMTTKTTTPTEQTTGMAAQTTTQKSSLLQTARVHVLDSKKRRRRVNVLLDSGSQRSFMTLNLAEKLGLTPQNEEAIDLSTMASTCPKTYQTKAIMLDLELKDKLTMPIAVNTLPTITNGITRQAVPSRDLEFFSNFSAAALADTIPTTTEKVHIDLLIGADYFWDIVSNDRLTLPSGLHLVASKLGFLLTGRPSPSAEPIQDTQAMSVVEEPAKAATTNSETTLDQLSNFWKLENIGIKDSPYLDDDETALTQFRKTTVRDQGRYAIKWPWKDDLSRDKLPNNYGLALGRMKSLGKRLAAEPTLLTSYDKVIQQQIDKGVIEEVVPDSTKNKVHYLPHHPVVTPGKSTKVRIVYDASAKSSKTSPSLNDCLYRGPVILPDLCGLLMRFRLKPIVVCADVEKAFLQIAIQPSDRDVTRFLWYKDLTKPQKVADNLKTFRFCRVPFGVVSSPFLLAATIQLHLSQATTSIAEEIARNLYVDNLIVTVSTPEEGVQLYQEAKQLFADASMNLRDWFSNSQQVMKQIPDSDHLNASSTKVLGINWSPAPDEISISAGTSSTPEGPTTKRSVLNEVASTFDPLGLLAPVTLHGKRFLRKLWEAHLDWDAPLDIPFIADWEVIRDSMQQATDIKVSRCIGSASAQRSMQLHVFTDASKDAYAAAAYLRVQQSSSPASVNLLYSKSRLAPNKVSPVTGKSSLTIPRMELLGVLIGSRMAKFVEAQLHVGELPIYIWTDAKCVLQWLVTPHHLTTFVANRIKEIKSHDRAKFGHVSSQDNPADLATRGISALDLKDSSLWWQGPAWLAGESDTWPKQQDVLTPEDIAEAEKERRSPLITIGNTVVSSEPDPFESAEQRSSSLRSLLRVTAICIRFISKRVWNKLSDPTKQKLRPQLPLLATALDAKPDGPLTAIHLNSAELFMVRRQQQKYFRDTIIALQEGTRCSLKDQLGVYLDKDGLLRCHGRLDNSSLPEAAAHPLLIARQSNISKLLIREVHGRLVHAGVSHTLAQLRQKFWVIQGRVAVKQVIGKCSVCRRFEGQPFRLPQMPQLPRERVRQSHPFQFVGLDYLGPFAVTNSNTTQKVWVCLFTCMTTRAVHLEVIPGLSTPLFLNGLKRFIARRGRPDRIVSDNAPQFRLAQDYLYRTWQKILTSPELAIFLSEQRVTWTFTTEFAPWQGGFYERLVGLVKRAFRKSIGRSHFTNEQFATIVTEVEATLNSRPLVYVPSDSSSEVITPNHFLAPTRKLTIPNAALDSDNDDSFTTERDPIAIIDSMQKKQKAALHTFWTTWRDDYLLSLRERHTRHHRKNQGRTREPRVGDIVIVKNDKLPRAMWKFGKILDFPESSQDDQTRSARVLTSNSILNRPISHLYPLEVSSSEQPQNNEQTTEEEPAQASGRPQRQAAAIAQDRLAQQLNDDSVSVNFTLATPCKKE